MNHRERVLAACNHEEPDRIPIDIGGMRSTGIHAIAYRKLRQHLGLEADRIKLYDVFQQLGLIDRDILERFEADVIPLPRFRPSFGIGIDSWKEGSLPDGSPALVPEGFDPEKEDGVYRLRDKEGRVIAERSEESYYYDQAGVHHPLADARDVEDIKNEYSSQKIEEEEKEYLKTRAKQLREETDYAIMAEFGGSLYEAGQTLRGYKQWYLDLAGNKDLADYLIKTLLEDYLHNLEAFFEILGENVDIIVFGGDDLGMQDAPQISPGMYEEMIKPGHEEMWKLVKEKTDWKVFLHSCGSIYQLLPAMIDAGLDIINPVHINAAEMEPKKLKEEFGEDLVFWGGGCDTQKVLPRGSLEDIREEVKRNIEIFAPDGGFVFTPVHNIQPDVDPEKIVTLYDEARKSGKYEGLR